MLHFYFLEIVFILLQRFKAVLSMLLNNKNTIFAE